MPFKISTKFKCLRENLYSVIHIYIRTRLIVLTQYGYRSLLGAVHILRQPPEGGEGVRQMLTIADEGGRGCKPNADHC